MKRAFRILLVLLILPVAYFGAASAAYYYRLRLERGAMHDLVLPVHPSPLAASSIVIVSPHPDDEILGCAGLIQRALAAGARLRIVFLTHGDGFRVAVERRLRDVRVDPGDFLDFGRMRQREALAALRDLGVNSDQITFLGYPDRGLMPMWDENWRPSQPYESRYTHVTHVPYERVQRPGAPYSGRALLEALQVALSGARPTEIYVTHPADDHTDHAAASAFTTEALDESRRDGCDWAAGCRLHYFLIHRGGWPVPSPVGIRDRLFPPAEMMATDTAWSELTLTAGEAERKREAIEAYGSQTAILGRFMLSFARASEIYGDIAEVTATRVADGVITPGAGSTAWSSIPAALIDPANDNLLRNFQREADIETAYLCRDSRQLYLRVTMGGPITAAVTLQVRIRLFGPHDETIVAVIPARRAVDEPELHARTDGSRMEAAIPLSALHDSRRLAIQLQTTANGITVDRTGCRFVNVVD